MDINRLLLNIGCRGLEARRQFTLYDTFYHMELTFDPMWLIVSGYLRARADGEILQFVKTIKLYINLYAKYNQF